MENLETEITEIGRVALDLDNHSEIPAVNTDSLKIYSLPDTHHSDISAWDTIKAALWEKKLRAKDGLYTIQLKDKFKEEHYSSRLQEFCSLLGESYQERKLRIRDILSNVLSRGYFISKIYQNDHFSIAYGHKQNKTFVECLIRTHEPVMFFKKLAEALKVF